MKKRNRRKKSTFKPKRPSRKLLDAVGEAIELYEEGSVQEAQATMITLCERYPRDKMLRTTLLEMCNDQQDWMTFAIYGEQLLALERGEERADSLNNLVIAYTNLVYPALAWQKGKELISQHPDYIDRENIESLVAGFEEILLKDSNEMFATATAVSFSQDEKLDVLVSHDHIRFYMASSQTKKAIAMAETLLEIVPDFIPALNNLSLACYMVGDSDRAIEAAQQVLAQQPGNYHALANMTRYQFLSGQFDAAQETAVYLKQVSSEELDRWVKQAEALAYLGDDEGVRQAYRHAAATKEPSSPVLLHLAATAHFRLGDEKKAWQLWQNVTKIAPDFALALGNLEDRRAPIGEQNTPWYWSSAYWFSAGFRKDMAQFTSKFNKSPHIIEKEAGMLLDKHPYLPQLFPHILDRGDGHVRSFIINFVRMVKTPELVNILYDFCISPIGSDALRMEALQFVQETDPDLLPPDRLVTMWIKGKQTELFTMSFEIYEDAEPPANVDEETLDKHNEAYELLLDKNYDEAELLFAEIIVAAPEFAAAYNHLALVYERQGRDEERRAMTLEIQERFPDYLFGCVVQAHEYLQEDKIEEARAMVIPFLRQERLHISEFRVLAMVFIRIALAEDLPEGARPWLNMWEQVDEGNPEIAIWRMRVEGPSKGLQGLRKLLGK